MDTEEKRERTIKAGLALDLTVRVTGGIEYKRRTLSARIEGKAKIEEWETEKVTHNPEEHARAVKARATVRNSITRLCARTPLGDLLLVPPDREGLIRAALEEASKLVGEHNKTATSHFLVLGCVPSRIVPEDTWTARSIEGEIMATLVEMEVSIGGADVEKIRDACDAASKILPMLSDGPKGLIEGAIEEARRAAREITRRIVKGDEDPADVIPEIQARGSKIDAARLGFGDLRSDIKDGG